MEISRSVALWSGVKEGAIEIIKDVIPGSGALIESIRTYRDSIEQQQGEEFVNALADRVAKIEKNVEWYKTTEGEEFSNKILATALNAEYADKMEFLANAFANGPMLDDHAMRMKFVEMIRQLSTPALLVLLTSEKRARSNKLVESGQLAGLLSWTPELAEACVKELYSLGVYSSTVTWYPLAERKGYRQGEYFQEGRAAHTEFSRTFAEFISEEISP